MSIASGIGPHGRRVALLADPDTTPGPSAELALLLESADRVDPATLDAATAIGVIEGIWAQVAHLQALQAKMITAMTRMPEYAACAAPVPGDPGTVGDTADDSSAGHPEVTADDRPGARARARARRHAHDPADVVAAELSAAVRISPLYARGLVAESMALITEHPATAQALNTGRIDWAKARAIMEATADITLDPSTDPATDDDPANDTRSGAKTPMLPGVPGDQPGDRAEDAADVEADEISDGDDATVAARASVEAAALRQAPEQTLRQLRGRLRRLVHRADPAAVERRAARAREDRKVFPPRPCGDGNATLTAYGPLADLNAVYTALDAAARHARTNREPGDDRTLDQLRFDALAHTTGWDALRRSHLGCCDPACEPTNLSAEPTNLPAEPTARSESVGRGDGPPTSSAGPAPCVVPRLAGRNRRPVQINIDVPLSVLLGLSDAPAEMQTATGPEPLAASIARALAFSDDATWRRLVTDPVTGTVLDYGRDTYVPPAALADHVRARDRTCRFPTASTPATSCELDHTVDHSAGGATSDGNIGALSPMFHTHKTLHAWRLEQPHPGTFCWTSPAGRIYVVTPDSKESASSDPLSAVPAPPHNADPPPW